LRVAPTELHDLAAEHPQRVETMAAEWHRMAREVLMATPREQQPVSPTPRPKTHREWSDYSGKRGDNTSRRSPRSGRIGEGNQPE
jgi:hypothetical protein